MGNEEAWWFVNISKEGNKFIYEIENQNISKKFKNFFEKFSNTGNETVVRIVIISKRG